MMAGASGLLAAFECGLHTAWVVFGGCSRVRGTCWQWHQDQGVWATCVFVALLLPSMWQ
jgi:hypothetical protein